MYIYINVYIKGANDDICMLQKMSMEGKENAVNIIEIF